MIWSEKVDGAFPSLTLRRTMSCHGRTLILIRIPTHVETGNVNLVRE